MRSETGTDVSYSFSKSSMGDEKAISTYVTSIPVVLNDFKGHLDIARVENNRILFGEWSANVKNFQLPEAIINFCERQIFYSGQCNLDRPDVAKAYDNPALRKAGFKYYFPLSSFEDIDNSEIRLFSVSKKGTTVEFICPNGYKWSSK